MCAWVITEDRLCDPANGDISRVGRGQWGLQGQPSDPPDTTGWKTFWLLDDDGELYYVGKFDEQADELPEGSWGALDQAWHWGMYDAGAVDLRVTGKDGKRESVFG